MRVFRFFYGVYPKIYGDYPKKSGVYPNVLWSLPEHFVEFTRKIWKKYATLDLLKINAINI